MDTTSPGSDYLPGDGNPTPETDSTQTRTHMRTTRTLEIDMTLPEFGSTVQIPFTESNLGTFSRQYSEMVVRTYEYTSVEQEMED